MPTYNPNDFYPEAGKEVNSQGNVVNPADSVDSAGNQGVVVNGSKYLDLGQIITGGAIAASGVTYSNWFDNSQWVRNMIIMVQCDQTYSIAIYRRDSSLQADNGVTMFSSQAAAASSFHSLMALEAITGNANPLPGYSFRIGIINNGSAPTTVANVRLQLIGQ